MAGTGTLRPQIALLGGEPELIRDLIHDPGSVDAVDWLVCRRHDSGVLEFARGDDILLRIDPARPLFDLPDLVAVLGLSGRGDLEQWATAWTAALPQTGIAMEWLDAPSPRPILESALRHLSRTLAAQRARGGRMALELAAYRREFERMQHDFKALEGYVAATDPAPLRDEFDYPQSRNWVSLGDQGAGEAVVSVQQKLPLNSLGVAAVSIALAGPPESTVPEHRTGGLQVALSAIETGQTMGSWSLAPTVAAGWLQLTLERAIDEAALGLLLTITAPAGAAGWAVCLGAPHPYDEFCARTPAGESLGAPLALRVQSGLPGTQVTTSPASIRAQAIGQPAAWRLSEADCATVSDLQPPPGPGGEAFVHYNTDSEFIQVHPRGDGALTIARLFMPPVAGAWRLSAQVLLAHEAANPTRFGMVVRQADDDGLQPADFEALTDGAPAFSGWLTLPALQRSRLSAILPDPAGGRLAVYLMTRQENGAEYAWARFSDLLLHPWPHQPG